MNVGERSAGRVDQARPDRVTRHATTPPPPRSRPRRSPAQVVPPSCTHPPTSDDGVSRSPALR